MRHKQFEQRGKKRRRSLKQKTRWFIKGVLQAAFHIVKIVAPVFIRLVIERIILKFF